MLLPGVRRPRNCSKMASEMKCFCQVVAQFVILSAFGGCNLRAQDQLDDSLRNIARCGGTVSRVGVPSRAIYVSFEAGDRPFDTARASTTSIDEGLTWLRNLPDLPGVSLSLKGVGIGDTTLVHIDGVGNLRELILENTGITDNGFSRLKELRNVNTLHLALNKKFTGVGFSGVKLPHLRDVSFFNDDLSNEGMRELAKFNTICRLELVGSQVTDVGLAHLKGLTELTQLTLMNNEIDGSGLGSLKALKHLCSLKVGGGDLTDRGMAGLGELTHLDAFASTVITSARWGFHTCGVAGLARVDFGGLRWPRRRRCIASRRSSGVTPTRYLRPQNHGLEPETPCRTEESRSLATT